MKLEDANNKPQLKGFNGLPLGCLLTMFVGGPAFMMLGYGVYFYLIGVARSALRPNPATGQIYKIIAGGYRGPTITGYATHTGYIIYEIFGAFGWVLLALSVPWILFVIGLIAWKRMKNSN